MTDHFEKPSKILEETETYEYTETFESEDIPVDEEISEPNAVPAEECFAQNEAVVEYVNAASHGASSFQATDLLKYVFKTLLCWNLCVFRWLKLQQRCVSLEGKSLQRELTTTCSGCFW